MKIALITVSLLFVSIQIVAKEKIVIKALETKELSYEQFADFNVEINNKSGKAIIVSVINPENNKKTQGFGMGPMGRVVVNVGKGNILRLKNSSMKDISITIDFLEREEKVNSPSNEVSVKFTLHNSSMTSIPLIIPNVMNPNLSPFSNSGVQLKMGQEIYYRKGGKKKLLMTVDQSIKTGDKIDVAKLINKLNKD